ncbi:MAG: biotin-dependent carboxyltransferase family protein [Pseudomonadota bacterium]
MSLRVLNAGIQTTVQAGRRSGFRRFGVPWSGPADGWSHALANRLVGAAPDAAALEIAYGGASFEFGAPLAFALTGAPAEATLAGRPIAFHETQQAEKGDVLAIGPSTGGARVYLAFSGALRTDEAFGSVSTYMPAHLGGYGGRTLAEGDQLNIAGRNASPEMRLTPHDLRPMIGGAWALRATASLETDLLTPDACADFFDGAWAVGRAADRMGLRLEGPDLALRSDGRMASAPVHPGVVQCPADGAPILLSADAQTTGGYPRIAAVIRADRHVLGQMRPGDGLRFLKTAPDEAIAVLKAKAALLDAWAPDGSALL